jgi:hypothetical protein
MQVTRKFLAGESRRSISFFSELESWT